MFLFRGIIKDFKARKPYYWDDWKQGFLNKKVLASILFIYFTSIGPGITFGVYLSEKTNHQVGTIEVILSTAISGAIYAVFAGQPLIILGVTGPISIFLVTLFDISLSIGLPFLEWLSWAGIWSGLMHITLAICNACDVIHFVTRFSCEIFGFLIAIIYVVNGIQDLVLYFKSQVIEVALFCFIVTIGTYLVATTLYKARSWTLFNSFIRGIIADYAGTISIIVLTGIGQIGKSQNLDIPTLAIPSTFIPTTNRSWLVPFWNLPVWGIFSAIIPGFIITALFYFDHNVSSLLSQKKEYNLKKPSAYNLDFLVLGVLVIITSIIGIPPPNGLIPQAFLHVRSLGKFREKTIGDKKIMVCEYVVENRVSNFVQGIITGITLTPPFLYVLSLVPNPVLSGFFLFMGLASFSDNQFADRVKYFFMDESRNPIADRYIREVPKFEIFKFTIMQLVFVGIIYGITWTPAAISFPVFIVLLVPFRYFILPKLFPSEYLKLLDHESSEVEEPENEQTPLEDLPTPELTV